jgi:hypothetical protein
MAEEEAWGDLVPGSPAGGMRWADHTEEHSPTLNALTEEAAKMRAAMGKKQGRGKLDDFSLDAPTGPPYFLDLSGLSGGVTEDQLGWFFGDKKVDVTRIEILRTKGGQSTGMACMEVGDEWSYKTALGLSNSKFKDRTLKVTASSKGKAQFSSRGGARGGSSSKYDDGKYGNGSWDSGAASSGKGKGRAGRFGAPAWDGGGKGGKGSYESAGSGKKGKDAKGKGAKEEPPAKGKGGKKEEPKKKKEEPKPVKKEEPKAVKKEEPKVVEEKDTRFAKASGDIPKERPKLTLLPRTRPMDAPPPESMKPKFDPFGGAKPRDETQFTKDVGEQRVADTPAPAPSPPAGEKAEERGKGPDSSPKGTPPQSSPSSTASFRGGGGKRGGKGKSPKSGEYVWRVAGTESSADAKEEDTPGQRGRGRGGKKRR